MQIFTVLKGLNFSCSATCVSQFSPKYPLGGFAQSLADIHDNHGMNSSGTVVVWGKNGTTAIELQLTVCPTKNDLYSICSLSFFSNTIIR